MIRIQITEPQIFWEPFMFLKTLETFTLQGIQTARKYHWHESYLGKCQRIENGAHERLSGYGGGTFKSWLIPGIFQDIDSLLMSIAWVFILLGPDKSTQPQRERWTQFFLSTQMWGRSKYRRWKLLPTKNPFADIYGLEFSRNMKVIHFLYLGIVPIALDRAR